MRSFIDTASMPVPERRGYLNAAMEQSPLPFIDVSGSKFEADGFRARFEGFMLGGAFFTRLLLSSVQLRRTDADIARRPSSMLLIALLHAGAYDQRFGYRGPISATGAGDILLLDLDAPQCVTFVQSSCLTCAYVPRSCFEPFLGDVGRVQPVLIRPNNELHGLLAACLVASAGMSGPDPTAASAAVQTLTRLAMVARGLHPAECDTVRASVLEARRTRAHLFINLHCTDPRLNATMVARHLGISPRSLHAAFEGTGTSVSARITAARLAHATRMLDGSHPFSMLDIALESGFNSLSTFYRTFAREFGVAPGERRRTTALPEATSA